MQLPSEPQAFMSQMPLHGESQQTPDRQVNPDWHIDVEVHCPPLPRATQVNVTALQSGVFPEHCAAVAAHAPVVPSQAWGVLLKQRLAPGWHVLHALPAQGYGVHETVAGGGQLPAPSQFAPLIWRPFEQLCPRHAFVGKAHLFTFVPSQ
jgi:hypothetical protein